MADEKSPTRISHRLFATSCSEMEFKMNIKNMKLKYRLAGIYLLTAVLPVIVLFTFSYGQMKHILIERDTKSIQNFVNQAGAGIDTS